MNRPILTAALLLSLAGCITSCATSTTPAPSPLVTVVAAEYSLGAAGGIANAYVHLPLCTGANGPVCADPAIKAQVKQAYDAAYAAVTQAQATADAGGSPDMTAASAALSALQSAVATLPQK